MIRFLYSLLIYFAFVFVYFAAGYHPDAFTFFLTGVIAGAIGDKVVGD